MRRVSRSRGADGEEYLARSLDTLGQLHLKLGDFAKAEPLLVRSLRFREKNLGTKHAATAFAMGNLALLYSMCGNVGQAEQLFQGCLAIEEEVFDSSEPLHSATVYRRTRRTESPRTRPSRMLWIRLSGPVQRRERTWLIIVCSVRYTRSWVFGDNNQPLGPLSQRRIS